MCISGGKEARFVDIAGLLQTIGLTRVFNSLTYAENGYKGKLSEDADIGKSQ